MKKLILLAVFLVLPLLTFSQENVNGPTNSTESYNVDLKDDNKITVLIDHYISTLTDDSQKRNELKETIHNSVSDIYVISGNIMVKDFSATTAHPIQFNKYIIWLDDIILEDEVMLMRHLYRELSYVLNIPYGVEGPVLMTRGKEYTSDWTKEGIESELGIIASLLKIN